jgi:starch-binding outer membrane protein, SusD/RagB family
MRRRQINCVGLCLITCLASCNKLVQIPQPNNTITTTEVFSNPANATSAITAIYSQMSWNGNSLCFSNGATSICAGLCSDELNVYGGFGTEFQTNSILPSDGLITGFFWNDPYFNIYQANAAIEGLQASTSLQSSLKAQLRGEAEFLRAFTYFYLVNLFGNIPLATTTSYQTNSLMARDSTDTVYQQIISDLTDAQNVLAPDFSVSDGARIRANAWAARALLSRVYLYNGDWESADSLSSLIIANTSLFSLCENLDSVFLANSTETILQLQVVNFYPYTPMEANYFVPEDTTSSPNYILSSQLLNAFEPGDLRREYWVDSTDYSGAYYYFPYKYQTYVGTSGNISQNYMLLRLAEQYLIRAEAEGQLKQLNGAINDLNTIRARAGLDSLPGSLDQAQVLAAVAQERRIELFSEWGHRWLDLKRTGQATAVLQLIKPDWTPYAQFWPIPESEIQTDPNLTQNQNY